MTYVPPAGDVGARTFTFAASNSAGVAMQTVSVTVVSFIPQVTATNVGPDSFTVNWTEVSGATAYQVQVATDTNFTSTAAGRAFRADSDPVEWAWISWRVNPCSASIFSMRFK